MICHAPQRFRSLNLGQAMPKNWHIFRISLTSLSPLPPGRSRRSGMSDTPGPRSASRDRTAWLDRSNAISAVVAPSPTRPAKPGVSAFSHSVIVIPAPARFSQRAWSGNAAKRSSRTALIAVAIVLEDTAFETLREGHGNIIHAVLVFRSKSNYMIRTQKHEDATYPQLAAFISS